LTDAGVLHRAPIGIFRDVEAPAYDDLAREQVALAAGNGSGADALQSLVSGGDTWHVR
jgi:2-oxoglutarate ferredoxin oxidoreductase subunit beta